MAWNHHPHFRLAYLPVLLLALAPAGCGRVSAVLHVSTSGLDFGSQETRMSFTVENVGRARVLDAGVTALEYSISADRNWLTVVPTSGRCEAGHSNTHVVEIDRALLLPGSNIARITILSNDRPWSILVAADSEAAVCSEPPTIPSSPAPGNGATAVPVGTDLAWSDGVSRCSGLVATYDIYFGTTSPPSLVHDNGSSRSWDPGTLANGTTYYWRIIAKDTNGSTSGPVWSFTTEQTCLALPTSPCTPSPPAGASNINENTDLTWGCGNSQCSGLVVTYDVYFGTNPTPGTGELLGNTGTTTWVLPRVARNTTYYWQIVAKDANGSTPGPVWSFRTRA